MTIIGMLSGVVLLELLINCPHYMYASKQSLNDTEYNDFMISSFRHAYMSGTSTQTITVTLEGTYDRVF
jgi:hypothetical protein